MGCLNTVYPCSQQKPPDLDGSHNYRRLEPSSDGPSNWSA